MDSKRTAAFYPLLLGIYPVLALAASNMEQASPLVAWRALLVSLAGAGLLFLLLLRLLKDAGRAALLSAFLLLLFFSYGHAYGLLEGKSFLGRHRYLMTVYAAAAVLGTWLLARRAHPASSLTRLFNFVSIVLLVLPLLQMGQVGVRYLQVHGLSGSKPANAPPAAAAEGAAPDVYYIILDGYTRADMLQRDYGLDISDFLRQMEELGFVFPDCAQSNYTRTALSLSSALNMNYVDTFSSQKGADRLDFIAFADYIRDSAVRREFTRLGYQTVAFDTGFWFTEIPDADILIRSNDNPLEQGDRRGSVNSFEMLFLRTTALRVAAEAQSAFLARLSPVVKFPEQAYYDRTVFAFDQLERLPQAEGRKFVFAHLIAPHAPFVFAPDGQFVPSDSARPGYPNEITYLNQRVLRLVKTLIETSPTPPVIILQGDHGWDPENRVEILNAYYLPGEGQRLYDTITPVNTFRLVFDAYFGGKFGLLEDVTRFSTGETPFQFEVRPATCMGR